PKLSPFSSHSPLPHRDLHSFPTRRSSDLLREDAGGAFRQPRRRRGGVQQATIWQSCIRRYRRAGSGGEIEWLRPDRRCSQKQNRSEEHTSELQSRGHLVCRLLLEKKKQKK